jgi:hypothetical protein
MTRLGVALIGVVVSTPVFAAGPYPAAPPPSGSPFYGQSSIVGDAGVALGWLSGPDSGMAAANARVNVPWASGWNEEVETAGVFEFKGVTAAGVFTHSYFKTQEWAAGTEVGVGELNGQGVVPVGIEGVVFLPNAAISGQAVYNPNISKFRSFPDFWTVSLTGSYYFEPNTKLAGTIFWSNIFSNDLWVPQVTLEHRWAGTPFSTYLTALFPNSSTIGNWIVAGGVSVSFDQPNGTLHSHDYEVPFSSVLGQFLPL